MSSFERKKTIYCGNCGKRGHTYRYCREPVISIGILLFYDEHCKSTDYNLDKPPKPPDLSPSSSLTTSSTTSSARPINIPVRKKTSQSSQPSLAYSPSPPSSYFSVLHQSSNTNLTRTPSNVIQTDDNDIMKFLLICRKDTFGYVEFIRGRYGVDDETYLTQLFREMSLDERHRLQTQSFETLWNRMWINQKSQQYRHEFERSKKSFAIISSDSFPKNLAYYDAKIPCLWSEPEWGIPKGRRNLKESDMNCAKREFLEETGIDDSQYTLLENLKPIEETFVGTNDIRYKHIYYLARCNQYIDLKLDKTNLDQMAEVSKIGWFSINEAKRLIRPYNIEKIAMIENTHGMLQRLPELQFHHKDHKTVI